MSRNAHLFSWSMTAAALLAIAFILTPILVLVAGSFTTNQFLSMPVHGISLRWYLAIFDHPEFLDGFVKSVQLGILSAILATVCGTLAAIGLDRIDARGRNSLSIFMLLPLMVPWVIIGISMLQFFSALHITSPYVTLLLGHTVITFPYVVRAVAGTLGLVESGIERAAANLGARPWQVLWHVTVPSIRPGVVGGLIIAFTVSFDAVAISIFLQTPDFVPLPVRLYNFVEAGVDPVLAALSTLLMLFSAVSIYAADRFIGLRVVFAAKR